MNTQLKIQFLSTQLVFGAFDFPLAQSDLPYFLKARDTAMMDGSVENARVHAGVEHTQRERRSNRRGCPPHGHTWPYNLPMKMRIESKAWLHQRGYTLSDDGDVPLILTEGSV